MEIIPLTVGQMREMREYRDDPDQTPAEKEAKQLGVLREHIVGWNWVDEDGISLAIPSVEPAVLDGLTTAEVRFLVDALNGAEETELKN